MKTVVGLFDNSSQAHRAIDEITRLGIGNDSVSIVGPKDASTISTATDDDRGSKAGKGAGIGAATGAMAGGAAGLLASLGLLAIPGIGPLLAAGPLVAVLAGAGIGAATGGLIGGLIGLGIPEEDAEQYEEGVRRGGTLVTVTCAEDRVDQVSQIMDRNGAVNVDERAAQWRSSGWKSKYAGTSRTTAATSTGGRDAGSGRREEHVPVVEERLDVSKRQVSRGGVRVYSQTTEQPVSEQVNLHKENVHVERRNVDRPATEADLNAFKEGTIEMRETSEEAVVQKKARVTGEVVVRKDVEDRTETVKDKVRRTDVKVERIEDDANRQTGGTGGSTGQKCDT